VLTFASEYRFTVSRRSVPAGPLRLQLRNIGEDDHDLRIVGPRGGVRAETGKVRPGRVGEIRTRLSRGRYTLICTVGDHEAHGMRATLLVTKRLTPRPARR
jgi:hypothetical protein